MESSQNLVGSSICTECGASGDRGEAGSYGMSGYSNYDSRHVHRAEKSAPSANRMSIVWAGGTPLKFLLAILGLAASACVAQSVVVVGETPLPPPTDVPMVTVAVVDDLGDPVTGATVVSEDQRAVSDDLDWRHSSGAVDPFLY